MKFVTMAIVACCLVLAQATPVKGQAALLLGVSSTFPMGTLTSTNSFAEANVGWQATVGARWTMGSSGAALGARAIYGRNGYEGSDGSSTLVGVTALGTWSFLSGSVSPLFWLEAGFLSHSYSADSGGLLGGAVDSREDVIHLAGGAGLGIPLGAAELLLLGGYSHAPAPDGALQYLVVTAAASVPLG